MLITYDRWLVHGEEYDLDNYENPIEKEVEYDEDRMDEMLQDAFKSDLSNANNKFKGMTSN